MPYNSQSIDEYRPMNRWDHSFIQPGNVGSVGSTVLQVRLKHSAPDLPLRYDPLFSHKNMIANGSNVQNGSVPSYVSDGGPARVVDSNWGGRRHFKVRHGWIIEDMRAPDKAHEPEMDNIPSYDWNNRIATAYQSNRTGNMFLPVPGPYQPAPGEQTRGGMFPSVTQTNVEFALPTTSNGRIY